MTAPKDRDALIEVMARASRDAEQRYLRDADHTGVFDRSALQVAMMSDALAALEAAGVALVPVVVGEIAAERQRQIDSEGWSASHDDEHTAGQLAGAAACYALTAVAHWGAGPTIEHLWPWSKAWWKPKDNRRNLVRAAALIVAEIERLDRAASPYAPNPEARSDGE